MGTQVQIYKSQVPVTLRDALISHSVAHIASLKGDTIYFTPSSLNLEKQAHPLLTPKRKQLYPLDP